MTLDLGIEKHFCSPCSIINDEEKNLSKFTLNVKIMMLFSFGTEILVIYLEAFNHTKMFQIMLVAKTKCRPLSSAPLPAYKQVVLRPE